MESMIGVESSYAEAHIYKHRLSIDEVECAVRESDGLVPGSTVNFGNDHDLPNIFDIPEVVEHTVPRQKLVDCFEKPAYKAREIRDNLADYASCLGGEENKEAEYNTLYYYSRSFLAIERVGHVIADIQSVQSKQDDSIAWQEKIGAVRKYIDDFIANNPDAELDINQPRSVAGIGEFIEYYKAVVHETTYSKELINLIENNRQILIDTLNSRAMKNQLGAANAKRIAQHFAKQPLIIVDPLTAILESPSGDDYLGWFMPHARACYIDPLTINSAQDTDMESMRFKAGLLKTMAHEFMHAATNNVYRGHKEEGSIETETIKSRSIWPKFFVEGMVEKAAYMLALNAKSEWFAEEPGRSRFIAHERVMRARCSDNPKELLATKAVIEARDHIASSYPEYRLLIDTIMDKADWQAASLSRRQAERFAIGAFFDRTDDKTTLDSSARKAFMQAVHKATHPGFINKIGDIARVYGTNMAMDILESPNFDPHDSSAFPMLVSSRHEERLRSNARKINDIRERIERLHELKAPNVIIEHDEQLLQKYENDKKSFNMLIVAKKGLENILRHTYGQRKRNLSIILLDSMFNKGLGLETVSSSQEELQTYKKAIQDWNYQKSKP